ncbi:hypothetical protein Y032_0618g710 [Ancylostoma ceylanicum]|nr:hypothetical protein Y032_0618g710 [Ancylostoma ceylanicum]
MKERLMEDSNNARVKAMSALRKLTIREGQSVGEFCLLLERLAAKAYPDVPPEATSLQKAEILFNQLANWEGSYNLSEALEVNDKGQAYEKVKEAALRLERTKKTAKEMAVGYKNERTQHYRQHTTIWRKWSPVQKRRDKDESDEPRNKNIEMSKGTSTGSEEIKCFRCGKMGHMAKKCKTVLEPQQRTAGAPSRQPPIGPPNHGSFSAMLDRLLCTTTKTAPERHSYLFGSKTITPIILMGLEVTALLDTGSETSIVPLSVFRTARNMRIDIDSHVKRIPQEDAVIRNASGQRMSFVDTIQMDVTLYGETKSVAFHVGEGLDDIVILGTNALEVFGIQLGKVEPMESAEAERPVRDEEPECEVEEARVLRRIFLPPGGTTFIPLGATLRRGEAIFVSHNPALAHGICRISAEGTAEIPIVNVGTQPVVFRKGEVVGVWQEGDYVPRGALEEQANMMEKQPNEELNSQERTQTLFELVSQGSAMTTELEELVMKFSDVFAVKDSELTQTDLVVHEIDTGDVPPIKQKTRPVPIGARQEFKEIIKGLLERGIIRKSKSDWASPVVLVRKKDGTLRLCVDYRALNKVTKQDSYPLPTIDNVLQSLSGKKFFSTLDLASGYWQIKLSENAKPKSAFTSSEGLYEFEVLPFGLCTSPAVFQRMMDMVLDELGVKDTEVFVYIDILVATDTKEKHFQVLQMVLGAMRKANLRLKPQKCHFLNEKVEFLGHVIQANGVSTDPDKIRKMTDYPTPKNVGELRTFLGMASYYRKFILRFAKIAKCLYELTSTKAEWKWTEDHEQAFAELKKAMSTAPVLGQPNLEGASRGTHPFIIYTDASGSGLGAVLCQEGADKMLHPLYFASKSLSRAERNYHITDLEALGVVFALKKFHFFIYGLKTIVRTDHKSLTSLFKQSNVSAKVLRWALEVQKYKLEIQYVAGKANAVADALSRGAAKPDVSGKVVCDEDEMVICSTQKEDSTWLAELREDPDYSQLIADLNDKKLDKAVKIPRCSKKLGVADFVIENGDLVLLEDDRSMRVVPKSRRKAILEEAHAGAMAGHLNGKKLLRKLKKSLFWEGMEADVMKWARSCKDCFLTRPHEKHIPPLKPITTSKPFELIGMDLVDLGLSESGNRYALVVIDHFLKFVGAYPIPDKSARTVARTLFERWICDGCRWPKAIHSDQGPEFVNSILSEICEIIGIKQTTTKGYNPRENGMTERVIGTLTRMLRKQTVVPAQWDRLLPMVAFAYNSAPHEAIGDSPFFTLHAFDPNGPSKEIPAENLSWNHIDFNDYKYELLACIQHVHDCVKELNQEYCKRMKRSYDSRNKTSPDKLPKVGDRVYLELPREKASTKFPKLVNNWSGPFRVLEVSDSSALITPISSNEEPIRVQHDALIILPMELDDEPVQVRTKRVARKRKHVAKVYTQNDHSRAIQTADGRVIDNSALSIFYSCSGRHVEEGEPDTYNCSIRRMTFGEVAEVSDPVISSMTFSSILQLARLISIFENEPDADKKRFLMRNSAHMFVTVPGVEKAYAFFKRYCDHVTRALLLHDGSSVALTHNGGVNMDVTQLSDLTNAGIRFAQSHSWDEVVVRSARKSTMMWLPRGFRSYNRAIAPCDNVIIETYNSLADICAGMKAVSSVDLCVFVTPTSDASFEKSQWVKLSTVFAAAVRNGTKLVAVSGPQGEAAWEDHRQKTLEALQLVRDVAAMMKHNVVSTFSQTPAFAEPFTTMGRAPRRFEADAYPAHLMREFFTALQNHILAQVNRPLYEVFENTIKRSTAYKQMKKMEPAEAQNVLRSIGRSNGNSSSPATTAMRGERGIRGRFNRGRAGGPRGRGMRGRWTFVPY